MAKKARITENRVKKIKKKSQKKTTRLRYKGRFIPSKLEASIRAAGKKIGRGVRYNKLVNAYYENRQRAIDNNFEDYTADDVSSVDELESGLKFIYYMFSAKLRDALSANDITRPKYYIKRWGDDFYQRVGKADLTIEKDEFLDDIWDIYSDLQNSGVALDSPKFTFVVSILKESEEVYLDLNLTEHIPDEVKALL